MRFLSRGIIGLALTALTLALLALAAGQIVRALGDRAAGRSVAPAAAERVFAVNVETLAPQEAQPVLTAYGDVRSTRRLEMRAEAVGELIELAPGFRDGGLVAAGEVVFRVDPAEAEAELALSRNAYRGAQAEELEAEAALALAREELAAAERQRDLRQGSLLRAEDLRDRGVSTAADLEVAELAFSTANQALTGRRLALAQAEARIERAAIARERAGIERDEAARRLENTVTRAPFGGVMSDVDVVLGRLASPNERLGVLLDPAALEVAFRISSLEFARLAYAQGVIPSLDVTVNLEVDGVDLSAKGRIERVGVAAETGQSGRLIYAAIDGAAGLLRPGDFVTVELEEPTLQDVAVLPATAVGPDGGVLLVGADDRLEAAQVDVLRRQKDIVIVGGAPFGRELVSELSPQLGPGVMVRALRRGEPTAEADVDDMVALSDEQRAGLIASVEANERLGADAKARILAALAEDAVPRRMLDRIEARRSGG